MAISTFDLFKIGIGPSSSHTVGPMLAANSFVAELQQQGLIPDLHFVRSELFGSLGLTGLGHGTGKAVLMGLQGELPHTVDVDTLVERVNHIRQQGLISIAGQQCCFADEHLIYHRDQSLPYHANGMRFTAYGHQGSLLLQRSYYSIGGGFVLDEDQAKQDAPLVEDQQVVTLPF